MIARCIVMEEEREENGQKAQPTYSIVWRCTDVSSPGALVKDFDYLPTEGERARYRGKVCNRIINIAITDIWEGFARRLRAKGRVIEKEDTHNGDR